MVFAPGVGGAGASVPGASAPRVVVSSPPPGGTTSPPQEDEVFANAPRSLLVEHRPSRKRERLTWRAKRKQRADVASGTGDGPTSDSRGGGNDERGAGPQDDAALGMT